MLDNLHTKLVVKELQSIKTKCENFTECGPECQFFGVYGCAFKEASINYPFNWQVDAFKFLAVKNDDSEVNL